MDTIEAASALIDTLTANDQRYLRAWSHDGRGPERCEVDTGALRALLDAVEAQR